MDKIYTIEEAAVYLKCSTWSLYQMCKEKSIPHFRIGNRIRFTQEGLEKHIKHQEKMNCRY